MSLGLVAGRFLPVAQLALAWPAHAQAPVTGINTCDRASAAEMADCLGRELAAERSALGQTL